MFMPGVSLCIRARSRHSPKRLLDRGKAPGSVNNRKVLEIACSVLEVPPCRWLWLTLLLSASAIRVGRRGAEIDQGGMVSIVRMKSPCITSIPDLP